MTRILRLITLVVGLVSSCATSADAIIRSQAMYAGTIAEYYIQQDEIRVELEIGLQDLQNFRNLMPDEIYQEMGHTPRPLAERLVEFFSRDLVIATTSGPLAGQLLEIGDGPELVHAGHGHQPFRAARRQHAQPSLAPGIPERIAEGLDVLGNLIAGSCIEG